MVKFQSFVNFCKKPGLILTLILIVFILKGAIFATLLPFLQGFDEDKHLATVQYYAEPKEKTWPITDTGESSHGTNYNDLNTFNFSEEEISTSKVVNFGSLRINSLNTYPFIEGIYGDGEQTITEMPWQKYIDKYPPTLTGHGHVYYILTAPIVKLFWGKDIFTRFSAIRLISVLFGVLTVLLTFFIAKKIGFSQKISLLIAAITAFQPLFSQTSATINTDNLLISLFTLFIFGGVSMLKDGINWRNFVVVITATVAGAFTKAPGVAMLPVAYFLFLYAFYKKFPIKKAYFILGAIIFSIFIFFLISSISPYSLKTIMVSSQTSHFNSTTESITNYLTTSFKKFTSTELSYWGIFGLLNAPISRNFLYIIWPIEIIALFGLVIYLFKKKADSFFSPDKQTIIFLLAVTIALQFAVRFADWRFFDSSGKWILRTFGRYFIPTLVSHILLIILGYRVFFKKEKSYENFVKIIFVMMILLLVYSIFNIIIPRYYL